MFRGLENARRVYVCVCSARCEEDGQINCETRGRRRATRGSFKAFPACPCCGLGRRFFIFNLSGKGAELLTQVEWFEPHNRVIKSFLSDA